MRIVPGAGARSSQNREVTMESTRRSCRVSKWKGVCQNWPHRHKARARAPRQEIAEASDWAAVCAALSPCIELCGLFLVACLVVLFWETQCSKAVGRQNRHARMPGPSLQTDGYCIHSHVGGVWATIGAHFWQTPTEDQFSSRYRPDA
jgi:hypothetical protein